MALIVFLAFQLFALVIGGALLWSRTERQAREIASLRQALELLKAGAMPPARPVAKPRANVVAIPGRASVLSTVSRDAAPPSPASSRWRLSLPAPIAKAIVPIPPATARGTALGLASSLPALALFFASNHALVVACGLSIAAGMMLLAFNPSLRSAAWASVFTGGAWALIGFAMQVAHAQPLTYCIALMLPAAAGLAYALLREPTPGATLALIMSSAALALGSQIGMVGEPGVAFAMIVSLAAIAGATSLRAESIHLAAFVATLIGLFVLSGQESAAIWFTPVTAWAGALFLGIAAVRVPRLGARGVALAGTGALAPLLAIAALNASHQGLADPRAAGAAFLGLAALLGGLITLTTQWRGRGVSAMKLTLWVLACAGFASAVTGVFFALPAPLAATAFAAIACGLAVIDRRFTSSAWRTFACIASIFALFEALSSIALVLRESPAWDGRLVVAFGLAIPSALTGSAALLAHRSGAAFTASLCKVASVMLSVLTADVLLRLIFSNGAPLMQPIGFVEAGFHVAAWLMLALFVAARASRRDATAVRTNTAMLLGAAALVTSALIAVLWLTPYWETMPPARAPWAALHFNGLGFIAPALLFWAHWVFWRARGSNVRTRIALGAAAILSACFITLEAMHPRDAVASPDTLSALIGALSFAAAIVVNFAPGVTAGARRRSYLQEDFHADRSSEKRRQAR
ncbi:MAG: hypothetical protein HY054_06090 [Proteobacteria bacterium]|nr:hypothetical protein [Pseudomonadota bacterium]